MLRKTCVTLTVALKKKELLINISAVLKLKKYNIKSLLSLE